LKIGFIGDIIGRPGRNIIKDNLFRLRSEYGIDFVVANGENLSHGFGLTLKNCDELFDCGVDCFTGGNHTFDKKQDIEILLEKRAVLRPDNLQNVKGSGLKIFEVNGEKLAVLNLMGVYGMPQSGNPFNHVCEVVTSLRGQNIKNIFIDFHAEATSEKYVMLMMQKGLVSAICGTHTHVGTDDLQIVDGTFFVSDVGLSGCFDGIIGMDIKNPIKKATLGTGKHFDIPKNCKSIMQMMIIEIDNGRAIDGFKVKVFDDGRMFILKTC